MNPLPPAFGERLRAFYGSIQPKTWLLVVLGAVCIALIVLFGFFGLLAGIALILASVALLVLRKSTSTLEERKQFLNLAGKEAEKRFLKRLIDEPTYRKIVSSNERKLIEVEAEIKARESLKVPSSKEVKGLDSHSRHKLNCLLADKRKAVSEFELAKTKFYKHKIDDKTFQEIASEKQSKIVEIDTLIADLYRQEAKAIMQDTERRLKTLALLDSENPKALQKPGPSEAKRRRSGKKSD